MALSFKEVAEIIRIIDGSSCEELVLEAEGMKLVVRRAGAGAATDTPVSAAKTATPAPPAPASPGPRPAAAAQLSSSPAPGDIGGDALIEKAPMVGTFYRRPAPDEAPFVEVGAKVSAGDPLCMIEVMKLYTTITSSYDGVVESIFVDDATLVEFDQPLFLIRPN